MKNTQNEYTRLRNEALYAAYKEALRSGKDVSNTEAIQMALRSPQPRMWVPFYGVYRALLAVVTGSRMPPKNMARKNLLREVEYKYNELVKRRAFKGASLFFLASFIAAEPSTGFYISEASAIKRICKMRKMKQGIWRKKN